MVVVAAAPPPVAAAAVAAKYPFDVASILRCFTANMSTIDEGFGLFTTICYIFSYIVMRDIKSLLISF